MAYWFGGVALFAFLFYYIPLLKYVLARWLLDAGFLISLRTDHRSSTLVSWGTLGRSWDVPGIFGTTRNDTLRSRLGSYRFWFIWGKHLESSLDIFKLKNVHFHIDVQVGCLGLENQAFGKGGILQISTFAEIRFLTIPGTIFQDFEFPWDQFS